jgi:predicted nucleotidyltransferase
MQFLKRLFARRFDPAAAAEQTVQALKANLGPELASVAAFGSWAVGEFVDGHSDLNLLVVTRRLDADVVKRLAPAAGSVASAKCRPLYFSQAELRRFAEAFPLEFQDMAETRKVLFGEDPFQRLEISSSRLSEELESEARNRLIKFRQRWLLSGGADDAARELAAGTMGAILPLLKGMLRLKKRKPPRQRVRVIEDACRQFRLSRRTLLQAHDLRYGRKNAGRIDSAGLLDRLLAELERLAEICVKLREEEQGLPAGPSQAGERRDRGERESRSEGRGDREGRSEGRGDREGRSEGRGDRGRSFRRAVPGDRNKRLAEVRQMMTDAGQKKRWEPKEPERFLTDEMGRDSGLSLAARFAWDRAWQPERRAKGYVPVKPAEPELPPQEDDAKPAPVLSGEEAIAAAWADEVEDPAEALADAGAEAPEPAHQHDDDEPETHNAGQADAEEHGHEDVR